MNDAAANFKVMFPLPPPVMKMALSPLRHSLHSCSVFVSLPLRFDVSFSFDSIRSFLLLVPCTIAKKNVVREISEMNFSEDDSRLIILPTELQGQRDFRHGRGLVIERISRRGRPIIENLTWTRAENKIERRRIFGTSSTIFPYCSYSHHARGDIPPSKEEHSKLFPPSSRSKVSSPIPSLGRRHHLILFPPRTPKLHRDAEFSVFRARSSYGFSYNF